MEDWLLIPSILLFVFIRLIGELFFRGGLYWFILLLSVVLVWLAAKLGWVVGWWRKLAGVVALFVVINIPFVWQPLRAYLYFNELCAKHVPLRVYEPIVLGPDDFHEDGWPKFMDRSNGSFVNAWKEYASINFNERKEHGAWVNVTRVFERENNIPKYETRSLRSGEIRTGLGVFYSKYIEGRQCDIEIEISRGDPLRGLDNAFIIDGEPR